MDAVSSLAKASKGSNSKKPEHTLLKTWGMLRARAWASPFTFLLTENRSQAAHPVLMPSAPAGCLPRAAAAHKEQPHNPPQQCRGRGRVGEALLVSITLLRARVNRVFSAGQGQLTVPVTAALWRCLTTHKSGKCLRCSAPALSQLGSPHPDPQPG